MDRWIDGQLDSQIDGQMDRWINGQMNRWIDGQIDRLIDGQMERWRDGEINRQTDRQLDSLIAYSLFIRTRNKAERNGSHDIMMTDSESENDNSADEDFKQVR